MPVLLLAGVMACSAALAGKPEGDSHGNKHHKKPSQQQSQGDQAKVDIRIGAYFGDQQREAARDYYTRQYSGKRCPPGLAKKNNGCRPPGQVKKWQIGQSLPGDVIYYPVPSTVSVRLGLPPAGHRYVRVANDILLIAIGTSLVVDAIDDLMR